MTLSNLKQRELLMELLHAALSEADPSRLVPPALPPVPPEGRTVVVGAGKASAAMARAAEEAWGGDLSGLVLTRYGHAVPCRRIEIVEAAHPIPDAVGVAASARVLSLASGLGEDDLLLVLVSGGGSALLSAPAPGIRLEEKRAVSSALLQAGASIHEINTVRKHMSSIKGGRLAIAAAPAAVHALAISDVPGDDPATIASGPTVPDPTTLQDALAVIDRYRIELPSSVKVHLAKRGSESPKPDDARFARARFINLASARDSLRAAALHAKRRGFRTEVLGDSIEGPARDVALRMADTARRARLGNSRRILLSGGECTVEVRGTGQGGPNAEFALAFAVAMEDAPGVCAICADTDGIDGTGDHAGAVVLPDTLARAKAMGLDPRGSLANNDAAGFFGALGDLVRTGPTRTNVSDFRAIIVEPD